MKITKEEKARRKIKRLRQELTQIKAGAQEAVDFGDSHEKAEGHAQIELIELVRRMLPVI